jgi:hypothetical protein
MRPGTILLNTDRVEAWPGGRSARLQVLAIRYQPESAGELHR